MTGAYPVLHSGSFGPTRSARPVRPTRAGGPWIRTFRGVPASVPEARRFAGDLLADCPAREVLLLCVSELSANAIRHTDSGHGGVFIVEVGYPRDGVARVAVTDEGGSSIPAAGSLDVLAEDGRGLALVAACTTRWGHADAYPGRTVWAEASWPVPVPSPPVPSRPVPSPPVPARAGGRSGSPLPFIRRPLRGRSSRGRPSRDWPPADPPSGPAA